jgi:hypothetical protein
MDCGSILDRGKKASNEAFFPGLHAGLLSRHVLLDHLCHFQELAALSHASARRLPARPPKAKNPSIGRWNT